MQTDWNIFGMTTSPYVEEVQRAGEHVDATDVFVGRASELADVTAYVHGCHASRIAVAGADGIGKRTFVRMLSDGLRRDLYWPVSDPVVVTAGTSTDALISHVVAVVSRTIQVNGTACTESAAMQETRRALEAWDPEREVGAWYFVQAQRLLREVIRDACVNDARGVVLHLAIASRLSRAEIIQVARQLCELRDSMLMVSGLHVVLTGSGEAIRHAVSARTQMSSVFSLPLYLAPLSLTEVMEMLQRRYEAAAGDPTQPVTSPVNPDVVAFLYELLGGNVRALLKTLDDVLTRWMARGDHGGHSMTARRTRPLSLRALRRRRAADW